MAGRAGPQAGLGRGQAEGHRGVHVGEEWHRGRGRRRRRPREASQGRRAEQVGFQQREGVRGRRDERQRFQRAGQLGQAGGRVCARGCGDGFFLRVPDDGGRLGQPLGGRFGRGFLLLGGGGGQGGLLGPLGRRRGAAGAVGADVEVLEEGTVGAEAQQAVLTLEVAVGFVVHFHVGHEVLHAGEGLCAAQRGALEGFALKGLRGSVVHLQVVHQLLHAGKSQSAAVAGAGVVLPWGRTAL